MKHIKKFNESKEQESEIEELLVWLKDDVDSIKVEPNGGSSNANHYNIDISLHRDSSPIDKIVENAERMLEITKEYVEILNKLEDIGYKVSYHLLTTTQHLNFFSFSGKIQVSKPWKIGDPM